MGALVPTSLGGLYVTESGTGPVTVFFHSLFVDQRSWDLVLPHLNQGRRVVLIDAPNHGRSEPAGRDFTIDDCAVAAGDVLDQLGIAEPVDWVGNALGGHVGITLAATQPDRVRSLVTIGTPVESFGAVDKWTQIIPLVQTYRVAGPIRPLVALLENALLGAEAVAAQPDQARVTMDAFRNADRPAMLRAMRCLMLGRRSLSHLLPSITAPTLMLVAEGGQEGWTPADSARAAATMPKATSGTLPGAGHIGPLLLAPELVARRLEQAWAG